MSFLCSGEDMLAPQPYGLVQKSFQAFEGIFSAPSAFVGLDDLVGIRAYEPGTTSRIPVRLKLSIDICSPKGGLSYGSLIMCMTNSLLLSPLLKKMQSAPQVWIPSDEGRILQPAPFRPFGIREDGSVLHHAATQLQARLCANTLCNSCLSDDDLM